MCGISGIVSIQQIKFGMIHSMTDLIKHRGPDGEGYIFLDNQNKIHCAGGPDTPDLVWNSKYPYSPNENIETLGNLPFKLAFGHRRLSIIDLSPAGHQPMSYLNGKYWIIYNGEIYNYIELRNELELLNYSFLTHTDTEVILASYTEWGENCLEKFAGMWAFVIYDSEKSTIFLSRDRYGIKPLYYWFSPDHSFCFASEIKQFSSLPGWQAKINPQRAYDNLVYSITDHTDETMFAGVYQLPGGSYFKASIKEIKPGISGKIDSTKWYRPVRDQFNGSFVEASLIFKDLFQRSVAEHLRADVQIGSALSGGLDSSAIVCEVNRILRKAGLENLQKTFSSCSSDERFDERKWMDIIVNYTRIDAHFVYPEIQDVINMTSDIIWYQDEPYQSQSAFLANIIFKLAKANSVTVLLNGQGADEYLGGYGQFTIARYIGLMKKLKFRELLEDIKKTNELNPKYNVHILRRMAYNFLPDPVKREINSISSSYNKVKSIIDPGKMNLVPGHPFDDIPVRYRTVPEISEHLTFYSTLPKYLHWEDRNSMSHSVEARVPFLDHRLVEFTYNLPDNFLERNGVNKLIMREALKTLLPEKTINRRDKMGYTTPEEKWVIQDNPALFRQKISECVDLSKGIIKPIALNYFDRIVKGKYPFDYTYWRLILFGEWIRKFNVGI